MKLEIDMAMPPQLIEEKIRELRSIDREILLGIFLKVCNVDIAKLTSEALRKGQDEGYRLGRESVKNIIESH